MKNILRYKSQIILGLTLIVCPLIGANVIKYSNFTREGIVANKDLIDVITKILSSTILAIGLIASYYRFFRGRTFAARADLKLDVAVYNTEDNYNLHVINLEVINIGSIPIREPHPTIVVYIHKPQKFTTVVIDDWSRPMEEEGDIHIIDSQENAQYHATRPISQDVLAVTYVARVKSRGKVTWKRAVTVSNKGESRATTTKA